MCTVALRYPGITGAALLVALAVVPTALVLTTDREPPPAVQHAPARPDGCVMFCSPTPEVQLKAATRPTTPKEKCVMLCEKQEPKPPDHCWLKCPWPLWPPTQEQVEQAGDR